MSPGRHSANPAPSWAYKLGDRLQRVRIPGWNNPIVAAAIALLIGGIIVTWTMVRQEQQTNTVADATLNACQQGRVADPTACQKAAEVKSEPVVVPPTIRLTETITLPAPPAPPPVTHTEALPAPPAVTTTLPGPPAPPAQTRTVVNTETVTPPAVTRTVTAPPETEVRTQVSTETTTATSTTTETRTETTTVTETPPPVTVPETVTATPEPTEEPPPPTEEPTEPPILPTN